MNILQMKRSGGKSGNDKSVLESFGVNLNEKAKQGKIDPVIGREDEIQRVIQILARRTKNNPVLIGSPGVGKTAIAEGIARLIVDLSDSEREIAKSVIWTLDMGSLVAGTNFRGQFEERLKAIINEVKKRDNVILFIDEIHTIMGAGNVSGNMDAANMLKPALARGDLQCIGATTLSEYKKSIENDGALERRFQKVLVEPTSLDETISILESSKQYYEDHHNVTFSSEVVEEIARMADRYISDRHFPDKAFDVMDEAGSRVHLNNAEFPEHIEKLYDDLDALAEKKAVAVNEQRYEEAANLRDEQTGLQMEIEDKEDEWLSNEFQPHAVSSNAVAEVVSMITGIPGNRVSSDYREKVISLEENLKKKIIGQNEAVESVSRAIRRSASGIRDPRRPIATLMFLGQTGVGKTETAKQLNDFLFGESDEMVRFDMSEFMSKSSVSKMIGSPPGYVGFDEGGKLTEAVRRKPHSVILFDEIEKAHHEVYNLLLQIMDDGQLTDGMGRTVDFTNCVLIMTSNVGAKELTQENNIGFGSSNTTSFDRSRVIEKLKDTFTPEFLNRVDEKVIFNELQKSDLIEILDLHMEDVVKRLENQDINLTLTDPAKQLIVDCCYNPEYGARPLQRAVRRMVEEPLSEQILKGNVSEGDSVKGHKRGDSVQFNSSTE